MDVFSCVVQMFGDLVLFKDLKIKVCKSLELLKVKYNLFKCQPQIETRWSTYYGEKKFSYMCKQKKILEEMTWWHAKKKCSLTTSMLPNIKQVDILINQWVFIIATLLYIYYLFIYLSLPFYHWMSTVSLIDFIFKNLAIVLQNLDLKKMLCCNFFVFGEKTPNFWENIKVWKKFNGIFTIICLGTTFVSFL